MRAMKLSDFYWSWKSISLISYFHFFTIKNIYFLICSLDIHVSFSSDCLFMSFAHFSLGLSFAECKNLYIYSGSWCFGGYHALQISFLASGLSSKFVYALFFGLNVNYSISNKTNYQSFSLFFVCCLLSPNT